jgi:hydroxymethylglutaryl-CoA synthase
MITSDVGIVRAEVYLPRYRLTAATIGWNRATQRVVANYDEDAQTMAVAAARSCLAGLWGEERARTEALFLASTTLPQMEKSAAAFVAVASDLRQDLFVADVTTSLRAGTVALGMAADRVAAGRADRALVVASDLRLVEPESEAEAWTGDAAAAVLVGRGDVIARFVASAHVADELYGLWRGEGERWVRSWEERFVAEEGFLRALEAVAAELRDQGFDPASCDRVIIAAPDPRRHRDAVRTLGIPRERVHEPAFGLLGNCGTGFALVQLVDALEQAEPGERVLVANWGDGADAWVFETTERLRTWQASRPRTIRDRLAGGLQVGSYAEYLKWRGLYAGATPVRQGGVSASALHREVDEVLRLHGTRCRACGAVSYPPQRGCPECRSFDEPESVPLADERGRVFTYAMDYITPGVDVPLVLAVVDLENGARLVLFMTDRDLGEVRIDMPVELRLRLSHVAGSMRSYYWKAVPVEEAAADVARGAPDGRKPARARG